MKRLPAGKECKCAYCIMDLVAGRLEPRLIGRSCGKSVKHYGCTQCSLRTVNLPFRLASAILNQTR